MSAFEKWWSTRPLAIHNPSPGNALLIESFKIECQHAFNAGLARAAEICKTVGRPVGAGDGDTYVPGSSADCARAIEAEIAESGRKG